MTAAFLKKLASAGDVAGGLSDEDRALLRTVLEDVRPFDYARDIISRETDPTTST